MKSEANIFLIMGYAITDFINTHSQNELTKASIIDHVPNHYIFWKDKNSVYLGCNSALAHAVGLSSSSEIVGKTDYDLPTSKEQSDAYIADDHDVMESKKAKLNIEEYQTLNDGKTRVLMTNKAPLFDYKGDVCGILAIYSDITERKQMELDLKEARKLAETSNHAKTEFIANMSHDIRTPLSGLIGMSSLLIDALQNPETKQYAQWLNESGEQLLALLNGILDIISADNINENALHQEYFDLRECIKDITELEHPTTYMKGLDLRIDIEPSIPKYIKSDRTKLHRILLNLLGNAIKFTDKGYVSIEAKLIDLQKHEATIRFSVADTGIGIAADQQDKVFDRFHRAVSSYKGVYAGHGVGLHIAQSYAALLGGTITLESKLGVGTNFNFDLVFEISDNPDVESTNSIRLTKNHKPSVLPKYIIPSNHEKPESASQIGPNVPHILLVEDNHIALKVAESIVASAACCVKSAVDGEQALELAKTMAFNLIITDIGLPGISGYEFAQSVRKWETTNNKNPAPIVGLTAHAESNARDKAIKSGMNDVFSKPISLSLMQNILTKYVLTHEPEKEPTPVSTELSNTLGVGLPQREEELFFLDLFPHLDIQLAINSIGDENMLREILQLMISEEIKKDIGKIEKAHSEGDWETVEKLAHKMKGGAVYTGTTKMKYACQYLERYQKAGHTRLLEPLYQQLISVLSDTQNHIKQWLADGRAPID